MPGPQDYLIGGDLGSEEYQRLRMLELVVLFLKEHLGVSLQEEDSTAEVQEAGNDAPEREVFVFPDTPHLPEIPLSKVLPERTYEEALRKKAVLGGIHPRSEEDIRRDLERIGLSISGLMTEKERVRAEIGTWLVDNSMTPRTALIYVEEIVRKLRERQVAASESDVRTHLFGMVRHV